MFGMKQRRHTVVDTLVGSNSKINGDVHFQGGCHIDGTVKGNVTADPDSESALSISDIGNIEAAGAIDPRPSSRAKPIVNRGKLRNMTTPWLFLDAVQIPGRIGYYFDPVIKGPGGERATA